jgi:hypothetical protein
MVSSAVFPPFGAARKILENQSLGNGDGNPVAVAP